MKTPVLEVRGLKKYFPVYSGILRKQVQSVKAVDGVDIVVHEKEIVGIVGESGCGKSTAGRAAIRLIEPTSGTIQFLGEDLLSLDKDQMGKMRTKMQMVFQDPYASLNPRQTVGSSIGEALIYHQAVSNWSECQDRVALIMQKIGLSSDMMNRYPHQFSGGQQQRICIGRAIAMNPRLIVCDEAVSALDVSIQAQIINLLKELRDSMGLSYLFISHDLSIVRYICDRVIVLYLGHVMEEGPAEELFENPKHPYTQALLSAVPKIHPREIRSRMILQGELPSVQSPPSGCPFRTRCPYAKPECARTPPKKVVGDDHSYHCILD